MSTPSTPVPGPAVHAPDYRHNFCAFLAGHALFGVAFTLFSPSSVLPAFVGHLTDSAPVIGLITTVLEGGWRLPQIPVARLIGDKPRKRPVMLIGMIGRIAPWIIALSLVAGLASRPTAMLVLFFTCLALFSTSDGIASVAWFDILARAIPPKRRGRLMGTAQTLSGLFGIGAGALIGFCLNRFTFPGNYALIFGLAGLVFLPTVTATFLIREPRATDEMKASCHLPGRDWLRSTLVDADFRLLLLSRFLVGTMALASSFYVKHASDALQLPPGVIGQFIIAQTLSSLIASAGLGVICERWGPHTVIHIGGAAAALGPLFALVADLADVGWLTRAYPIVYVALGIINSTWLMGFVNYALEIAPAEMRAAYTGVLNTGMSLLVLLPMAGGWLLEATSYTVLFGATALLAGIGFLVSLRLRAPRTRGAASL